MSDETTDRPAKPVEPFSTPQMVAIEAEIAAARAELAATVDELVARADPRALAARLLGGFGQLFSAAVTGEDGPEARKRALTVLGSVAAGVLALGGLVVFAASRRGD
ncbi:DUF3618 domain-containing protein [Cellulomonas sp. URHE0023]|uniref:DUF3618 domain-containing protein n=1 Tax=Cellulomonas sp. URHE0023 TaxID=1380354 RepID=UPI00054D56F0|nr:DUF3618 domain-containing protein [Cellulomonas sp. URHE0023]